MSVTDSGNDAQLLRAPTKLTSGLLLGGGLLIAALQVQAADAVPALGQDAATPAAQVAAPAAPQENSVAAEPVADTSASQDATTELDAVVVRAKPRIQKLQDVPKSVSVVQGQELERLDAVDLGAITSRAGNVTWNLGNSRTSSISIRGIGKQAQTDAMDPSVGISVDGVAYAYNPLASFDFTDIDAIEVFRGPQGTQGGKNASLGLINVTTRRPTFTPEANVSVTLGQNNRVIGRAAVGGPVIDNLLAWRGAFSVDKGDGVRNNAYNSDNSFMNHDNVAGRVSFLLTPSENFNALIKADLEPRHSQYYNGWVIFKPTPTTYADGKTNPLTTDASTRLARRWFTQYGNYSYLADYLGDSPNLDNQYPLVTASRGTSSELNWTVGGHTLTSITAYKDYQFQARNDEGTPFDISKNGGGHVYYNQFSEELRLSSKTGGLLDYQTGLYYLTTHNNYDSGSGYGSDAGAWFASAGQYTNLDVTNNAGRDLLSNSLKNLVFKPLQQIRNESIAAFANANWHVTEPFTVTTGLRLTKEDRKNTVSKLVYDEGNAPELDPSTVAPGIANPVQLAGFSSDASTGLLLGGNSTAQLTLADSAALKYFGVAATATPGDAYNGLSGPQKKQIATAKAIRLSQLGALWNNTSGPNFKKIQPTIIVSPTYKINSNLTSYVSYQHGEKAGISQVINGTPFLAAPEKTDSYELGLKSILLDNTLTLNADVFLSNIKNYQQSVQVLDPYTTQLKNDGNSYYTAATGNAAKVQVSGVEIDGLFTGIKNTSIRFSAAYNKAIYKDFKNSGQPLENGDIAAGFPAVAATPTTPAIPAIPGIPYRDVSGQALPGAAKITANVGIDYNQPVFSSKIFHTSLNYAYTSRYNSDPLLSSYGWVSGYGNADAAIGLGRNDKKFDVSIVAKNLFNNQVSQVVLWNSYVPTVQRWFGINFSAKI